MTRQTYPIIALYFNAGSTVVSQYSRYGFSHRAARGSENRGVSWVRPRRALGRKQVAPAIALGTQTGLNGSAVDRRDPRRQADTITEYPPRADRLPSRTVRSENLRRYSRVYERYPASRTRPLCQVGLIPPITLNIRGSAAGPP